MPGLDVQDHHHDGGARERAVHARTVLPAGRVSYLPPQTTKPDRELRRRGVRRHLSEVFRRSCNTAFAEMGVDPRRAGHGGHGRGVRLQPGAADRPAGGRRSRSSRRSRTSATTSRTLAQSPASARTTSRPRRCRWRWWPPAVANNGVMMTPHVMAETVDSTATCSTADHAAAVADGDDSPRPRRPCTRPHGRRRAERHRPVLPAARQRHPGGGQDRHRPAGPRGPAAGRTRGSPPSRRPRAPRAPSPCS